jgi:hypothetical protein
MRPPKENARELDGTAGIKATGHHITFTLRLVAMPGDPDPIVRLRGALKMLRRRYRLRCVAAHQSPPTPVCGPGESGAATGAPVPHNAAERPAGAREGGCQ